MPEARRNAPRTCSDLPAAALRMTSTARLPDARMSAGGREETGGPAARAPRAAAARSCAGRHRVHRRRPDDRLRSDARESGACARCRWRRARTTRRQATRPARCASAPIGCAARGSTSSAGAVDPGRWASTGSRPASSRPRRAPDIPCRLARSWNCFDSERCARSVLATTMTPDVPRSSRCTMPGRSAPPTPLRPPTWCSNAFTSVPVACPAAGCTTMPDGLSITATSSSAYNTESGSASAAVERTAGSGMSMSTARPAQTASAGLARPSDSRDVAVADQAMDLRS